MGEGGVTSLEV